MFIKIPFEKIIDFKTNIAEITKISLEHDYNVNDSVVLGNFYVSGEYKSHLVSVNTDSFNYTLPFEVNITDNINKDTLEFNIEDFTYEICDETNLKINIEYSLSASKSEELFENVDEQELESELSYIDEFLEKERDEKDESNRKIEEEDKRDEKEYEKKIIKDNINKEEETYVTYHVHIVKENETIDSICNYYGISNSIINEYNNIDSINVGDKIIIPEIDD